MKTLNKLQRKSAPKACHYGLVVRILLLVLIGTLGALTNLQAQTTWGTNGNAATANDFLGTTNTQDLRFKVNNRLIFSLTKEGKFITKGTNLFMGMLAGPSIDSLGNNNIGLGTQSLESLTIGSSNIGIGRDAQPLTSSGSYNIGLGEFALARNSTGSKNVAIGAFAGRNFKAGDNNILIGYNTDINNGKSNDQLNIGNWIYGDNGQIGIGTTSPLYKLDVAGKARLTDTLFGTKAKFSGLASAAAADSVVMVDNAGNLHRRHVTAFVTTNNSIWSIATNNSQTKGAQFDGNIGIGTASPIYKLDIVGKAKLTDTLFGTKAKFSGLASAAAADSVVMVDNAGNLHKKNASAFISTSIWSASTNNAQVKGTQFNGNVGIGVANPVYKLEVAGKAKLADTLFGTRAKLINLDRAAATDSIVMVDNAGNLHKRNASAFTPVNIWSIAANNAQTKGAQFDGNIGIGTANPAYKLDIVGKAKLTDTLFGTKARFSGLASATVADSIVMVDNAGNLHKRNAAMLTGSSIWSASANNTQVKGAQFNGNVGIGTASPLYKLDIVGKAKLTDTLIGTKAKFTALATGDATDNLVTVDNSGNLRKLEATTLSSWSLNSSKQLYTNLPLAIGTGKNGSHANATQPGTVLTINGRTHIGKADGSDVSWVNYDQSTSVKDFLLYVQKGIITEDIGIATAGNSDWTWSDFVFEKGYRLRPLTEVEKYINANKHLPEIPSTKEIGKSGYSLNKMNSLFLQKIEELTLYSIAQEKLAKEQETLVKTQQEKIKQLEEKMDKVLSLLAQKGNQK